MTFESVQAKLGNVNFECKKDALRQNQDGGVRFTLNIHPNDFPSELYTLPMGQRMMCVLVPIGDDDTPDLSKTTPLTQFRNTFYAWCKDNGVDPSEVKKIAGVESLSDGKCSPEDMEKIREVWKGWFDA